MVLEAASPEPWPAVEARVGGYLGGFHAAIGIEVCFWPGRGWRKRG